MSETRNTVIEGQGGEEEEEDDEDEKCTEMSDKNQGNASSCSQLWDDDIIDITELDMDDEETWLLKTNISELSIGLGTWLKKDFHKQDSIESNNIIINYEVGEIGSTIDTRTFTRCKKKMAKLNFDSIRERALSTLVYNNDDIESSSSSSAAASWSRMKINWKEEETRNKDCIPAMLRQSLLGLPPPARINNPQESLEAFLNMSQSNGIDSFINMAEPEFNESLMNISRPSFLHTSSMSLSSHSMHSTVGINNNIGMADSQILTDSMMQTSIFNDVDNDNFSHDFDDNSLLNNTFNSQSEIIHTKSFDSSTTTATTSKSVLLLRDVDDETFTTIKCQEELGILNTNIKQESFIVNKTFDRLPSDCTHLSETITIEDGSLKNLQNTSIEAMNYNKTFDSNSTFSKISLNSTFKAIDVIDEINETNDKIVDEQQHINIPPSTTQYTNIKCQTNLVNNDLAELENNEPKSLDMTYSKRELEDDPIIENNTTPDIPVNRYQTYRKTVNKLAANSAIGKISLNYDKNYQGKSMEMLNKVSSNNTTPLYSQDIYCNKKLIGPKGTLSRLPQTLQKSNPNLPSHKTKKIIQQTKFGFQSVGRALLKNNQPALSNRVKNLGQIDGECDNKLEMKNSNDSIESTLSTYSGGPDFDDGLSTCSDSSRSHLNCKKTSINSGQLYKIARMQEEKLNQESTPKLDRKILDNTWIASEKDLPSPILKNNEIIGKKVYCCSNDDVDSEIQTSSPLLSPAESLQSLPLNEENPLAKEGKSMKQQENLPLNKLSSVLKPPQNLETKSDDGVRLPISRLSNIPSGIPRPASRIPAPRFSKNNAQIKSENNLKKSLF